jgi:hypothetical protein
VCLWTVTALSERSFDGVARGMMIVCNGEFFCLAVDLSHLLMQEALWSACGYGYGTNGMRLSSTRMKLSMNRLVSATDMLWILWWLRLVTQGAVA